MRIPALAGNGDSAIKRGDEIAIDTGAARLPAGM